MTKLSQQALGSYKRTWRLPLPEWIFPPRDSESFTRGLYFTISFSAKLKD